MRIPIRRGIRRITDMVIRCNSVTLGIGMNITELFARVITFFRVLLGKVPEVLNNKNRPLSPRGCRECG
ncbi:hypothetical protein CEB3_c00210 [Peptococcaceae bacterium CEB3]|nr:hypothetical protein CEB3_c00210 [Peptococcaceae bacterium CEB3]